MSDFSYSDFGSKKLVMLSGRIDGITSPELTNLFRKLILEGNRSFLLDFSEVTYISSVGIRVFMSFRKELDSAGGKMVFVNVSPSIKEIFKISGFLKIFQFIDSLEQAVEDKVEVVQNIQIQKVEKQNFNFQIKNNSQELGKMETVGSVEPLFNSNYSNKDVITINNNNYKFGIGLATAGNEINNYSKLFGETVLVEGNMFWYPAIRNSSADYMILDNANNSYNKQFLNGLLFTGNYSQFMQIESKQNVSDISTLVAELGEVVDTDIFGFILMYESKGFRGMNIKKVPYVENKFKFGDSIFAEENFADWFNFSLEDEWNHNLIISVGIAIKNKNNHPELLEYFPDATNFHLHSIIFEKGFINYDINLFEKELKRITAKLNPLKVSHTLGSTSIKNCLAGIIKLEMK